MATYLICPCCRDRIEVAESDLGKLVFCAQYGSPNLVTHENLRHGGETLPVPVPTSGIHLPPEPTRIVPAPSASLTPPRRGRGAMILALLVFLALAGVLGREWFRMHWGHKQIPPFTPDAGLIADAGPIANAGPIADTGLTDLPPSETLPASDGLPAPVSEPTIPPPTRMNDADAPQLVIPQPVPTESLPVVPSIRNPMIPVEPAPKSVADAPAATIAPGDLARGNPERMPPAVEPSVVPKPPVMVEKPVVPKPEVEPKGPSKSVVPGGAALGKLLARRINLRDEESLRRELQLAPEISLNTPREPHTATNLIQVAKNVQQSHGMYLGPMMLANRRLDLAGLGYRMGMESHLSKEQAADLRQASIWTRQLIADCSRDQADSRPDPDRLRQTFADQRDRWARPAALSCYQQLLQPESRSTREVVLELLASMPEAEATRMLAQWALFDLAADRRAQAVAALRGRAEADYLPVLLSGFRHPWPRAAEHAAEAIVELRAHAVLPDLHYLLTQPVPQSPFQSEELPGTKPMVREMIRVNHLANCLLCHPPTFQANDRTIVRGAIPDPTKPLPAMANTPAYYEANNGSFVQANQTYLIQDFSVEQPVANPGPWPNFQRYDYLVRLRPATTAELARESVDSTTHDAIRFAIRELQPNDAESTNATNAGKIVWLKSQLRNEQRSLAQVVAMSGKVAALPELWDDTFSTRFLKLTPEQQDRKIQQMTQLCSRLSVRAMLQMRMLPLLDSANEQERVGAADLLARLDGASADLPAERADPAANVEPTSPGDAVIPRTDRIPSQVGPRPEPAANPQAMAKSDAPRNSAIQTRQPSDSVRPNAGGDSLEVCVRNLRNGTTEERLRACRRLAELGPAASSASLALRARLDDPDVEVRRAAIQAILAMPRAIPDVTAGLFAATKDADSQVRFGAALGLTQLPKLNAKHAERLLELVRDGKTAADERERQLLQSVVSKAFRQSDGELGSVAKTVLHAIPDERDGLMREFLIGLLPNLGPFGDADFDRLLALLADPAFRLDPEKVMPKQVGANAVAALIQLLDHRDAKVRKWAVQTLTNLGAAARPALAKLRTMRRTEPDFQVQLAVVDALAKLDR
ncbi:HEAT repeat domain-containing protein [Tuwongella immobilis]|uniref:HEAT repeat domain-containing protein n=1 Tax=Tuwongella immobilis TaxID=692036 RepID=A0A6C2YVZ1_9BACT|nr:HEAT repeat domain-containing protein [Tuwongella immobilis]VIP05537.1 ntpase (nacht family) : Putative NTPase (NACHT family) OS=Rivularia sp. PCC 7116 GN=Riv7116_3990 PE=4 SV=1: HEAT_2 [Tuwongella immobilis]VTS08430.1 ntpase (nacht family) : Putative NTPase (NACHT family) OS=Rivularia sp. PCC 7116 GN=Riv7116_3990 PE=4 SV=1: HEAT_2 [Tuwongella immobilis]